MVNPLGWLLAVTLLGQMGFNPFFSEAVSEYIKIVAHCLHHYLIDRTSTPMWFFKEPCTGPLKSLMPPPVYDRAAGGVCGKILIPKHCLHHLCSGPLEKEGSEMQFTSDFPSAPSSLYLLTTLGLHFNAFFF